ncbi:hypothetical protein EYF80_052733 [Liparis tanakae]|uniref:Uncharacterized protein n=1 Tax=Liparis tanakae TaxID=230148 RepID=A0A4Z2F7D2_9TELE|nr:hypothetical protein EYF80_052733 [Liparis tanakae]
MQIAYPRASTSCRISRDKFLHQRQQHGTVRSHRASVLTELGTRMRMKVRSETNENPAPAWVLTRRREKKKKKKQKKKKKKVRVRELRIHRSSPFTSGEGDRTQDPSSLHRTQDPSSLHRTRYPSSPHRTRDPSSPHRTRDPSSLRRTSFIVSCRDGPPLQLVYCAPWKQLCSPLAMGGCVGRYWEGWEDTQSRGSSRNGGRGDKRFAVLLDVALIMTGGVWIAASALSERKRHACNPTRAEDGGADSADVSEPLRSFDPDDNVDDVAYCLFRIFTGVTDRDLRPSKIMSVSVFPANVAVGWIFTVQAFFTAEVPKALAVARGVFPPLIGINGLLPAPPRSE